MVFLSLPRVRSEIHCKPMPLMDLFQGVKINTFKASAVTWVTIFSRLSSLSIFSAHRGLYLWASVVSSEDNDIVRGHCERRLGCLYVIFTHSNAEAKRPLTFNATRLLRPLSEPRSVKLRVVSGVSEQASS